MAGGAWILDKNTITSFIKLGQKYGPVVGIHLGMMRSIVVSGYDTIHQVLSRDEFQGRPEVFMNTLDYGKGNKMGIMFSDGNKWREQRNFTLR